MVLKKPLTFDKLPLELTLEIVNISVNMLAHESGITVEENNLCGKFRHYNDNSQGNGTMFTFGRYRIVIIWSQNYVYLFDFDSRNADSFFDPNGRLFFRNFCLLFL